MFFAGATLDDPLVKRVKHLLRMAVPTFHCPPQGKKCFLQRFAHRAIRLFEQQYLMRIQKLCSQAMEKVQIMSQETEAVQDGFVSK